MPYSSLSDLPQGTSKLPKHAKEIYMAAFNSASEQYDGESIAHATAWAAIKTKYKKNDEGKWVAKSASGKLASIYAVVEAYLTK
jgi:cation transport regulator